MEFSRISFLWKSYLSTTSSFFKPRFAQSRLKMVLASTNTHNATSCIFGTFNFSKIRKICDNAWFLNTCYFWNISRFWSGFLRRPFSWSSRDVFRMFLNILMQKSTTKTPYIGKITSFPKSEKFAIMHEL